MMALKKGLIGGITVFLLILIVVYTLRYNQQSDEYNKGLFVDNEVEYAQDIYKRV